MVYLSGLDGFLIVGGAAAFAGLVVTIWIRWEDRHKRPHSAPPTPKHTH